MRVLRVNWAETIKGEALTQQDDLFSEPGTPSAPALSPVQVLPLGKYKGKPYDVLLTDSAYALWMLSSMYAKLERQHPALFAFLISRFGPPDHTPVHNALQNRFLDEDFCLKFALASSARLRDAASRLGQLDVSLEGSWLENVRRSFAATLHLSAFHSNKVALEKGTRRLEELRDALMQEWSLLRTYGFDRDVPVKDGWCVPLRMSGLEFEAEGSDASYRVELRYEVVGSRVSTPAGEPRQSALLSQLSALSYFRIEVKPVVGDDYPAVLRRMKTAQNNALLIDEFNGVGATWEQLVKVFALSNISVVTVEDVERVEIPAALRGFAVEPLDGPRAKAIVQSEFDAHLAALRRQVEQRPEPDPKKTGWIDDEPA